MSLSDDLKRCYQTALARLREELAQLEAMGEASKISRPDGTRVDLKPAWIAQTQERIAEYETLLAELSSASSLLPVSGRPGATPAQESP